MTAWTTEEEQPTKEVIDALYAQAMDTLYSFMLLYDSDREGYSSIHRFTREIIDQLTQYALWHVGDRAQRVLALYHEYYLEQVTSRVSLANLQDSAPILDLIQEKYSIEEIFWSLINTLGLSGDQLHHLLNNMQELETTIENPVARLGFWFYACSLKCENLWLRLLVVSDGVEPGGVLPEAQDRSVKEIWERWVKR
jgi:hypothetical protein